MIVSGTSLCYPDFYSQFHFVQRGARAVEVCPGVARLVGGQTAVPAHVGLSAQPQGDQPAAGGTHTSPDTRDYHIWSVQCCLLTAWCAGRWTRGPGTRAAWCRASGTSPAGRPGAGWGSGGGGPSRTPRARGCSPRTRLSCWTSWRSPTRRSCCSRRQHCSAPARPRPRIIEVLQWNVCWGELKLNMREKVLGWRCSECSKCEHLNDKIL